MLAGIHLLSGFSGADCDCPAVCRIAPGAFLRERVVTDKQFSGRITMVEAGQGSIQHLRSNQSLSRALLARSRADSARRASGVY
eukprot:2215439-Pyramimonas_sp.AAC.1